jgi:hypothetical protein
MTIASLGDFAVPKFAYTSAYIAPRVITVADTTPIHVSLSGAISILVKGGTVSKFITDEGTEVVPTALTLGSQGNMYRVTNPALSIAEVTPAAAGTITISLEGGLPFMKMPGA